MYFFVEGVRWIFQGKSSGARALIKDTGQLITARFAHKLDFCILSYMIRPSFGPNAYF